MAHSEVWLTKINSEEDEIPILCLRKEKPVKRGVRNQSKKVNEL
jgi:hypothetical protein